MAVDAPEQHERQLTTPLDYARIGVYRLSDHSRLLISIIV
jgi:hypothetical protein